MFLFWEGGGDPKPMGTFKADGGVTSFQTYVSHRFFWSKSEQNPVPIKRFQIKENQLIYTFATKQSKPELIAELKKERRFLRNYEKRTGRKWLASYPRPEPVFHIWNASYVGQEIYIPLDDKARHFTCEGSREECQNGEAEHLLIRAVTLQPRAFAVDGFLSDFESDYLIRTAEPRMHRSSVGSGDNSRIDPVRTSKSSWLRRDESNILDAIYRRLANVVNMPSESVQHSFAAEHMNILR